MAEDVMGRGEFAQKIVALVDNFDKTKDGKVVAIHATWGQGKTHFLDNHLEQAFKPNKYTVIRINAFENDYFEDPFILLAKCLVYGLGKNAEIKRRAAAMANIIVSDAVNILTLAFRLTLESGLENFKNKPILPISVIVAFLSFVFGLSHSVGSLIISCILIAIYVRRVYQLSHNPHIEKYNNATEAKRAFEAVLEKQAKEDKPIIFIIDELDRCKPNFALGLIERAKHFFGIPNVHFILMINRDQMNGFVEKVYGQHADAKEDYLYKFIDVPMDMPHNKDAMKAVLEEQAKINKFSFNNIENKAYFDIVTAFVLGSKSSVRNGIKILETLSFIKKSQSRTKTEAVIRAMLACAKHTLNFSMRLTEQNASPIKFHYKLFVDLDENYMFSNVPYGHLKDWHELFRKYISDSDLMIYIKIMLEAYECVRTGHGPNGLLEHYKTTKGIAEHDAARYIDQDLANMGNQTIRNLLDETIDLIP